MTAACSAGPGKGERAKSPGSPFWSPIRLAALLFWLQPIAYGSWLPRLPEIRDRLEIGPIELASALLGAPIGILAMLPVSGALVARLGPKRILSTGFVVSAALVALPALAPSVPWLFVGLAFAGASSSLLSLGLNITADRVETLTGRLVMNTCHGFWSLGLMTGSAIGAALAGLAVPPGSSVLCIALLLLPATLLAVRAVPIDAREAAPASSPRKPLLPSPALLSLCAFVFGITLTEGAAADWAAIFMRDVFDWPNGAAALAFSGFAGSVATGRFLGDGVKRRLGAVATARLAGALSLSGVAFLVGPGLASLAILGFVLLGVGLSVGFPLAVSASAALGDRPPAANVAILSMIALSGFLVGAPMIGGMAEHFGMRAGFAMVLPGLLVSLFFTFALAKGRIPPPPEPGPVT